MRQDLRLAIASIRRNPILALVSVLTLTLGIGLNAGVFTVVDGLMFRARVQKDPTSFIHLSPSYRGGRTAEMPWSISTRDYRSFIAESKTMQTLAGWAIARVAPEREDSVLALMVTCNFFDVYGLDRPVAGRTFTGRECTTPGAPLEAVIAEELWRSRYAGDPEMVGKVVRWNGLSFTVVGILPAGFSGRLRGPGIWLPWTAQAAVSTGRGDAFADDGMRWLVVEGRQAPGRTRAEVQSELRVIAGRLDTTEPGRTTSLVLTNGSFGEEPALQADVFWIAPLIMGGLTLILLIACTNVAILQLSRAVARQREMAIRLAIGAGKWRLSRMLLTETLLLAAIAAAASAAVAFAAPSVFAKMIASPAMPVYSLKPDGAVVAYLALATLLTTIFAGLSPAGESLRVNLAASMKAGDGWSGAGVGPRWGHGALVAIQVSLCLVLLVTAGLFLRAQWRVAAADPGFEDRHVLLVGAHGKSALTDDLRKLPTVERVAAGSPFTLDDVVGPATPVQVPRTGSMELESAEINTVSPEFFAALGVPLVRGRLFGEPDEVVVSEALARSFWPGEDPVGKRLVLAGHNVLVAGVARDLKAAHPGVTDPPHVYRRRDPNAAPDDLLVRFAGALEPVQAAVRAEMQRVGIETHGPPKTLHTILEDMAAQMKPLVQMVGVAAAIALLLAVFGIYGVVALGARRRTRELGIRMALGATKRRVIGAVLSSGLRPVFWGLGIGMPLATAAASLVAAALARTPIPIVAGDLVLYAAVALLLAGIGSVAMLMPAIKASTTDPMRALRQD
jgi:predicted permease